MVDEADPQLKAHWQKAALLGSPQLGTPQQIPRAPRGNVHASSQERAISLKRKKGRQSPLCHTAEKACTT